LTREEKLRNLAKSRVKYM